MKFSHGAMAPRGASDGKRRGGARLSVSVSGQRLESTRSSPLSANLAADIQWPWERTSRGLAVPPAATFSTCV